MDAYPPNSKKAAQAPPAQEQKHIERVTTAEARQRKQGLGKQFKKTFVGGDARTTVNYVFFSVLLPAARDMLVDAGSQGLERLIYGETRGSRRPKPSSSGYSSLGHVNYAGMHSRMPTARQMSPQARQSHNFGEIQVESRVEANNVLDRMYDLLSKYEVVTVADLYALTGISGTHVDHKWGWTDLRGASARRTHSGDHLLDLPEPEYLG